MCEKLITYYSQKTELITEKLLSNLRQDNPFQQKIILVPNSGLQRYLELTIAEKMGICTHIDIIYPGSFLWKQYQNVLPNLETVVNYSPRLLTYKILALFDGIVSDSKDSNNDNDFLARTLKSYRTGKQKYYLASSIARQILKYLSERPEIIDAWDKNELATENIHEVWQRNIYKKLSISKHSRYFLQKSFQEKLLEKSSINIPEQIDVFGFCFLPETQVNDLLALSAISAVNFYSINPSIEFWADITKQSEKLKLEINQADESILFEVGNPLLASWGYAGKYLIDRLNEFDFESLDVVNNTHNSIADKDKENSAIESIDDYMADSILELTQQNIQHLTEGADDFSLAKTDKSIQINVSSSARREIEILQDYLLNLFETTTIKPSDVIVMTPNINDYSAHIRAIFATAKGNKYIPYSIANQSAAVSSPEIKAFLSLLKLIDKKFLVNDFFEFCNQESIRDYFGLSPEQIATIHYWLKQNRVSWGYDKQYKQKVLNASENSLLSNQGHLQKLIDELYLASVMGDIDEIIGSTKPSKHFATGLIETLEKLSQLVNKLRYSSDFDTSEKTIEQWYVVFNQLSEAFFTRDYEVSKLKKLLDKWYEELTVSAALNDDNFNDVVEFSVVEADIRQLMENEEITGPFLSGGISFGMNSPMRSIPSKIICMLGLNQNFPSIPSKLEFDLCQNNPKSSDKNTSRENKYLFLETLLAARETLYLSYVGIDEKTNTELPPSIMVSELESYLSNITDLSLLKTIHPLQGFSEELFAENSDKFTYNNLYESFEKHNVIPSIKSVEYTELEENLDLTDFPTQWNIMEITAAFISPLQFYLKNKIGIVVNRLDDDLVDNEFITVSSGLEQWQLENNLINCENKSDYQQLLLANNLLAPDPLSTIQYDKSLSEVTAFRMLLNELQCSNSDLPVAKGVLDIEIKNDEDGAITENYALSYTLDNLTESYLLLTEYGNLKSKYILKAWLSHLILNTLSLQNVEQNIENLLPKTTKLLTKLKSKKRSSIVFEFNPIDSLQNVNEYFALLFDFLKQAYAKPLVFTTNMKYSEKSGISFAATLEESIIANCIGKEISLNTVMAKQQFEGYQPLWDSIIKHCVVSDNETNIENEK